MITLQQYVMAWIQKLISFFRNLWDRLTGQVLTFEESGITVRVSSKPLAEGGFSVVFAAKDVRPPHRPYALKRIRCHDAESRNACQREAQVHQRLQQAHPQNPQFLLPLYGVLWTNSSTVSSSRSAAEYCYMLFPMMPHSLRAEVNQKLFSEQRSNPFASKVSPWQESVILQVMDHVLEGVARMHQAGYSHRDIKLENILCQGLHHLTRPVLMDFGSAGPLTRSLTSRQDVLDIAETAGEHTTISYRPPELFPGELRVVSNTNDPDALLDYAKVDVWSCGCVLFALMYGASPFESEFDRRTGAIRIVECSQLRVLGKTPQPSKDSPASQWYSPELTAMVEWILTANRHQRPSLSQVQTRLHLIMEDKYPHLVAVANRGTSQALHAGGPASASSFSLAEEEFFGSDPFSGRSMTY